MSTDDEDSFNVSNLDMSLCSDLHRYIVNNKYDQAKQLISQKENVESRGPGGITPLMLSAALKKTPFLTLMLNERHALVDARDDRGATALLYAAASLKQ